jgi:predicted small lipoprotein YifL
MRTLRAALAGLMLLAALGACRSKGPTPSTVPDPNSRVQVEVENHYMGDVVIYLVHGSDRQRLGMVTALSSAEFSFPWRRLGASANNRLLAYPIAGASAYASDPLQVQPGQWIKWTLESDLNRSSMAVY